VTRTPAPKPNAAQTRAICAGIVGAARRGGREPAPTQLETLGAFATLVFGHPCDVTDEPGIGPTELAAALPDPLMRRMTVRLMVALEFTVPQLPEAVAASVEEYAEALDVEEPMVDAAYERAEAHTVEMYADIQRHSWYNRETARRVLGGELFEVLGSKIAVLGGPEDDDLAAKWRGLGERPAGSWGRGVYDFYLANGFAFPGEHGAIRVVGAEHDWVHVLADYDTSPEGEIDVFSLIAASMRDEEGLAMLIATLGMFQTGIIHHIAGEEIANATSGTLGKPGAPERIADAFRRGRATGRDVLGGLDHFEWADVPLDEARRKLKLLPKVAP
jgi:hypothetical protein